MQRLHSRPLEGSVYLSAFQAAWDINVGNLSFDRKTITVRHLVESAARLQQLRWQKIHPGTQYQPSLTMNGPECFIHVDDSQILMAWLDLLDNAFEYSDGAVHIEWCQHDDHALIAVLDEGMVGWGLTEEQAQGLCQNWQHDEDDEDDLTEEGGLSWAQAIIAAHGGELFIEGYQEGVPISPSFSTGQHDYPSLLNCHFRTAFIVALPIEQGTASGGDAS